MSDVERKELELNIEEKTVLRISVRHLVEFILRTGDIDNRHTTRVENAMQEGSRIHRMIQRRMGSNYQSEVSLKFCYPFDRFTISVEGRADGILCEQDFFDDTQAMVTEMITIDEIKGTYRDLHKIKQAESLHLAQAKCYAYIYAVQHNLSHIRVRITYCNIETEELKYFYERCDIDELKHWFTELMENYGKWARYEIEWGEKREKSIHGLRFPFTYREGQKDFVKYVYQTIYHGKKLFAVAPTGVGKTMSTIFPAVQAIGRKMGDKLFYLTAKTITRTVADEAFVLLREQGLMWKSVILTAKEKICPMEAVECNPIACPYAKGHYDRINDAIYDLLTNEDRYTREKIEEYAEKYEVCPFEMALDMSLFSDGIVCDYNYVFDPHAYLRRFFGEGVDGNYLFLVDEAHNLLERGRDMYSAVLCKEDFLELKRKIKEYDMRMYKQLDKCNKEMLSLKRECESFRKIEMMSPLVMAINRLYLTMEEFLQERDEKAVSAVRQDVLDFYFQICHFLDIYERVDENYVSYSEIFENGTFIVKLFCVNPNVNLRECMGKARSTILFSATLLPIQYYKSLLGGTTEDYEVYINSVFNPEKKALLIANDVTSKYTRRSEEEYFKIANYIHEVVRNRHGNYMVFFPSHAFLRKVYEVYENTFFDEMQEEIIVQTDSMSERAREEFIQRFSGNCDVDFHDVINMEIEEEDEKTLLGFCIMGGIFSEGIDLTEDRLIGVIIVGTGLPQVCNERELIKRFFDEKGENGFDYAYRFPGMNKVLQAAGRVIRTVNDIGVVTLLDERFLTNSYKRLFPREWETYAIVDQKNVAKQVEKFWNEWL